MDLIYHMIGHELARVHRMLTCSGGAKLSRLSAPGDTMVTRYQQIILRTVLSNIGDTHMLLTPSNFSNMEVPGNHH
jgi:hypothetical protein